MRRRKWIFAAAPLAIALFVAIGGEVVKALWNWLAPELFGWRAITFWQALGLLALCRILFGGFGGRGPHRAGPRQAIEERLDRMTPAERERLWHRLRDRCGAQPPADPAPEA